MSFLKKHRWDLLLLGGLLLTGTLIALILLLSTAQGTWVEVRIDGQLYGRYPLSENRTVEITVARGNNRLVIENGTARIEDADCPDKLCVGMGSIRQTGQSVICLPHKLVAEIRDSAPQDSSSSGADIIVR